MTERSQNYRIISEWGVLSSRENKRTGVTREVKLTKTAWFGKLPKWDLRNWEGDYAGQGVVIGFDDDLFKLRDMLIDICKQIESENEDD